MGRKQPTFRDANWIPREMRNERRNSILMTCHYPVLGSDYFSDWSCRLGILLQPIRSTTHVWVL